MADPTPVNPADLVPAGGAPRPDVWVEGDHPTANPDGVTVSNHDYWPKSQEEKAERLLVPMVEVLNVDPLAPYPEGEPKNGPDDRQAVLDQAHTKQEQVEAADWEDQHVANLQAGGINADPA